MCFSARHLCIALTIFCGAFVAQLAAPPVVLHEAARIVLPEPYRGADHVCLRGADMLIVAGRPDTADPSGHSMWAFVHYEKQSNGEWAFEEEVTALSYDHFADYWTEEDFTCEGGLAAFSGPGSYSFIFELTSAGWQATAITLGSGYPAGVAIHGEAVAFSGKWQAPATIAIVKKDASGQWTDVSYAVGNPGYVTEGEIMGPSNMEYAGTEAVATGNSYYLPDWSDLVYDMQVFDLVDGVWQVTTRPSDSSPTVLGDRIALHESLPWTKPGEVASLNTRDAAGAWTVKHSLLSDEALDLAIAVSTGAPGEIAVFEQEAAQRYRHAATLMASDAPAPGSNWARYSVDGEWIATVDPTNRDVYVYRVPAELPATQRLEETFEDNNAAEWMPWGDANWQIVSSAGSRAYRQNSTIGGARAILSTFESADQSIHRPSIWSWGAHTVSASRRSAPGFEPLWMAS